MVFLQIYVWVLCEVERDERGRSFAFGVPDRKKKTLLRVIRQRIQNGTTIIECGVKKEQVF